MSDIVKPKIDVAFKKMFTDIDNRDMLRHFISAVLDIDYDSITEMEILNPEITPDEIDGKFTRFDINMTAGGIRISIEIQIYNGGDFRERSLYYWAQNYSGQLKKGEPYKSIRETISINIIDFSLFKTGDYHSEFTMADLEHKEVLTDKCKMHFFELTKIGKVPDKSDKKKLWMQLINAESEGELEMLAQTQIPEIMDGITVVRRFSADDKMRALAMSREKAIRDEISALENARTAGRAEGMIAGRAEGMIAGRAEGMIAGRAEGIGDFANVLKKLGVNEELLKQAMQDVSE